MLAFDCWIKGIWDTLEMSIRTGSYVPMSGHDYYEQDIPDTDICLLRCNHCGKYSVIW